MTTKLLKLGHEVNNPLKKYNTKGVKSEKNEMLSLLKKNMRSFKRKAKWIIETDLSLVEDSDAVLAVYDPKHDSVGTPCEIFYAAWILRRPVYCITTSNNTWLMYLVTKKFSSLTKFIKWLGGK